MKARVAINRKEWTTLTIAQDCSSLRKQTAQGTMMAGWLGDGRKAEASEALPGCAQTKASKDAASTRQGTRHVVIARGVDAGAGHTPYE